MPKIKNIVSGQFETNCWLVYDDITKAAVIIDPGQDGQIVIDTIKNLALQPELLINTHGHFDHILSDDIIRKKYNIPLAIHKNDIPFLSDVNKNASYLIGKPTVINNPEIIFENEQNYKTSFCGYSLINTPGHTPGSVCILIENDLFSGDTLFAGSIGRTDFPDSSVSEMKKSLQKIKQLDKKINVYPGHGCSTNIEKELSSNFYLR
ncbi:MBL fold metallo-hydrolase [Candidatus Ruminimicrobium bovinum]|uniref:MBL fold metallo-hydrolase n=1 Tax=Candidatus Ruminimicrobium bovinum TaxID=3242779 RepID=UPI0039B90E94